jgi:hypothetical protein
MSKENPLIFFGEKAVWAGEVAHKFYFNAVKQ